MFLKCLWFLMERLQVFTEEFLFCSGFIPRWPQHPDGPPGVEAEAASCIDLDAYLPTAEDVQALALGGRGRCRDGRAPPLPRWVVVPPERPPNPRLCDFRTLDTTASACTAFSYNAAATIAQRQAWARCGGNQPFGIGLAAW